MTYKGAKEIYLQHKNGAPKSWLSKLRDKFIQ
jgi:hypothetical protein